MVKPQFLEKLRSWLDDIIQFPEEAEPQPFFQNALLEIDSFSKFAESQSCPYCHKSGLFTIGKYERGSKGWELTVTCSECGGIGIINETGFRFEKVER